MFKNLFYLSTAFALVSLGVGIQIISFQARANGVSAAQLTGTLDSMSTKMEAALFGDAHDPGIMWKLNIAVRRFDTLAQQLSATANVARQVSMLERSAIPEQNIAIKRAIGDFSSVAVALRQDADEGKRAIAELTEKTLPALNDSINGVTALAAGFQPVGMQAALAMTEATQTFGALRVLVEDPAIKSTLVNLNSASAELAKTGANVTATTGEIKEGIGFVVDTVRPTRKGLWTRVGLFLLKLRPSIF